MENFQPLPWSEVTMRWANTITFDLSSLHERTTWFIACFPKQIFLRKTTPQNRTTEKVIWIEGEETHFEHAHQLKSHLIERGWVLPETEVA